jgi:hypothetical protein
LKKPVIVFLLVLLVPAGNLSSLTGNDEVNTTTLKVVPKLESYYSSFYKALGADTPKPDFEVFSKALTGFLNLKASDKIKKNLLTIIDYSRSSCKERMWIIDMNKMKVVRVSLVAHGRNSGDEYARKFSNKPSSYQSSLGFYLTGDIYYGKNGMSLTLDGVEPDINDKARARAIVIHGADYVSEDFIRSFGRLGRSFGCPSIPMVDHEAVISELSGQSCIYIYYPDQTYLNKSPLLKPEKVLEGMSALFKETSLAFDFFPELIPLTSVY